MRVGLSPNRNGDGRTPAFLLADSFFGINEQWAANAISQMLFFSIALGPLSFQPELPIN
jgi:hypothetical protein